MGIVTGVVFGSLFVVSVGWGLVFSARNAGKPKIKEQRLSEYQRKLQSCKTEEEVRLFKIKSQKKHDDQFRAYEKANRHIDFSGDDRGN
jgi:hypothetical protein